MNVEFIQFPLGFYTFRAAIITNALFRHNIYFEKQGFQIGQNYRSEYCLYFDRGIQNPNKNEKSNAPYLTAANINSSGEIFLPISYISNENQFSNIFQKLTPLKISHSIDKLINDPYELQYALSMAHAVTFQWNMKDITIEDFILFRDILKNKRKACKIHGIDKVQNLIGNPLNPFIENVMSMLFDAVSTNIKNFSISIKPIVIKMQHRTGYDEWNKIFKNSQIERNKIYLAIIQTLINENDKMFLLKNTQYS